MIKIICGAFGLRLPNGVIKRKTAQDGPFELAPDVEARLVARGVAVYADDAPVGMADEMPQGGMPEPEADLLPPGVPAYRYDMTRAQLAQLLEDAEIGYPASATKADMIAMLDDYYNT